MEEAEGATQSALREALVAQQQKVADLIVQRQEWTRQLEEAERLLASLRSLLPQDELGSQEKVPLKAEYAHLTLDRIIELHASDTVHVFDLAFTIFGSGRYAVAGACLLTEYFSGSREWERVTTYIWRRRV